MKWLPLLLLAACAGEPDNNDVVGPYTGPVHRYVVDHFVLPMNSTEARELGADLNGDGVPDNVLGQSLGVLATEDNLSMYGDDMLAAGTIASVVEIQADSLTDDPTVSVRYIGRDGAPAIEAGGSLVGGVFHSNRTATTHVPGLATLHLPVFADADPSLVTLEAMELDFGPQGDGLYLRMRGGIGDDVVSEVARGLIQMIVANPDGHPYAIALFDRNRDGTVTTAEITDSSLIKSLLKPDVQLRLDGTKVPRLSFGIGVHVIPCPTGNCALATPANTCFDRVIDGDETDVDCGGSCRPCTGGATCSAPADCQSQSCSGTCAAPSCSDGVRSGFETDVDCGWNCTGCANGKRCETNEDCASKQCGTNDVCT